MSKINRLITNGVSYELQDYELSTAVSNINGIVKSSYGALVEAIAGEDYGYPVLKGENAPTSSIIAEVGQHYVDTTATVLNGKPAEYVCINKGSNSSTWLAVGNGATGGATGNVNLSIIADFYNSSYTYVVGDIVIYNNLLYRCVINMHKSEEWVYDHWEHITIKTLVDKIQNDLKNNYQSNLANFTELYNDIEYLNTNINSLNTRVDGCKANINELNTFLNTKAPMYTYGTTDLKAGIDPLETGKLYFVYE